MRTRFHPAHLLLLTQLINGGCVRSRSKMAKPHESNLELSLKNIQPLLVEIRPDRIFPLGLQLDVPTTELRKIVKQHQNDLEMQKIEIIIFWLENSKDRSWKRLAKAVKQLGVHDQLASKLESYCSSEVVSNQPGILGESINESHEDSVGIISSDIQSNSLDVCASQSVHNIVSERYDSRPEPAELRKYIRDHVQDKWEELADELGLDDDEKVSEELEKIKEKWKSDNQKAAFEVLKLWLKHYKTTATWRKLNKALNDVGLQEAVRSLNNFLSSCQNSPSTSGTTQAATAATQGTSTRQMLIEQNLEIMDMSTSQDSAISLSSSQSLHSSTKKHYEICLAPREYQKELAAPGIRGQNYIICAPTNSGKTLVAAMVIANHLVEKSQVLQRKPKVVFIVKTRTLADQQTQRLSEYIHNAHVECRTGNRGENRQLQLHIKDTLHDDVTDIIVCTAGKLLDKLKKGEISLQQFSLMIVDECHNTEYSKEYSNNMFAQIMRKYLELKDVEIAVVKGQLPQVVGLTATPGVGKNPGLDPTIAVDNLIMLCAHMDATGGIQTVREHKEELSRYVQNPESHLDTVDHNERKELQRIEQEMQECEQFLGYSTPFPRWSQQYEQVVKQKRKALEESDDKEDRDKVSTVLLLEHYSQTLIKYTELPHTQAVDYLHHYNDDFTSSDKLSDHEKLLREKFTRLKDDIKSLNVSENPILKKLELRLTKVFQQKPGSSGIVFVRTKEQAEAICNWISDSEFAKNAGINAQMLVGHKNIGKGPVMHDEDQKWVTAAFREGSCNLLVATSVAEEGLDIKQCNLIIRLHISGARSKAQMKGRARAAESDIITIVAHDAKKLFKDMINDELIQLTNQLIERNCLPSPQQLQKEITNQQKAIMENARKQKMLEKSRKEKHPAQDVEVKCKGCKTMACRGSDIYWIDKSVNNDHVVPGEEFSVLYDQVDHHTPGYLEGCTDPIVKKDYKIHCAKCNRRWGVMGTWPSGISFPVLKCESFNFTVNGKPNNFKQWKYRPFSVLPLSEWLSQSSTPTSS